MFADLQNEIADRILDTQVFFRAVCHSDVRDAIVTAKGMVFVELYAVYEHTVNTSVRAAISLIKSHATPLKNIRHGLLALGLHREVTAVVDAGRTRTWSKRLDLFAKIDSSDPLSVNDDAFPDDGSHYRRPQLETIWALFGLACPVIPSGRLFPLLDELVENRNAIAHGRRTAKEVGRGYSTRDVSSKIRRTQRVCEHIATSLHQHCNNPANYCR